MKKNLFKFASFILASALFFAGCAKSEDGTIDIGLAIPETHLQRWLNDGKNLLDMTSKAGYTAEAAYADADQAKQNQQISDFLTKGAKLIIVGNINEGVNTVIDDAASSNVQIIAYDRLI
ncbi:MAG: substrate-binding domain-containing protein, partial [Treponemataceae bacterium]